MITRAGERVRHPGLARVRLLLLVGLLLGVGAMHTLGHPSETGHRAPPSSATAASSEAPSAHGHLDLPPLDPSSMCLAVGGAVVALLSLMAVAFIAHPGVLAPPSSWLRRLALLVGPPPEPPSLARLQVLRV